MALTLGLATTDGWTLTDGPIIQKGIIAMRSCVVELARALAAYYRSARTDLLDQYSDTCLRRVWRAQRFSWWMTSLLHRFPETDAFPHRMQLAELDYLATSRAAATCLAENYVGLPFD